MKRRTSSRIAAIAIAGKHQRAAADLLARAVRPLDFDAAHAAVRLRQQPLGGSFAEDGNAARLGGGAQAVDQFPPGARRQPVHAQRRMARIVEIVDNVEGKAVAVRQPFDQRSRSAGHGVDDGLLGLAMRLALDVGGEGRSVVGNALGALEARVGGRDQAGRQRRRAGRNGLALDYDGFDADFLRRQRRAEAGGAGTNDQQRCVRVELYTFCCVNDRHQSSSSKARGFGPAQIFAARRPDNVAVVVDKRAAQESAL